MTSRVIQSETIENIVTSYSTTNESNAARKNFQKINKSNKHVERGRGVVLRSAQILLNWINIVEQQNTKTPAKFIEKKQLFTAKAKFSCDSL